MAEASLSHAAEAQSAIASGQVQASEPGCGRAASRVRIAMAAAQQQVGERDGHPERVGENPRFAPRPSGQVGVSRPVPPKAGGRQRDRRPVPPKAGER